ncbi:MULTISPECIES: hypothetical protein [Comamonadaceae]|jgi:hypothetical protein|uniref:DUF6976 family protein n=1 Tax=Comamonadaceae TaxID=80864 RepID=UPI000BC374C4|nr:MULTISPECIES: hypothetical protein [Comamonadaceae]OZA57506.1 MAG: hypothetical protein B7X79_06405 [Acidovorax sp. 17-64-282]HQT19456.1 hypothetical protein [Acidovorax defluvii]OYY25909.1 MAG: hypothetical protein B7Y64_17880 [Acidovorax sp. 35-64-16]OYY85135.1 MAG: hypothetical protein B7Y46_10440 [Acidovorax sp. 28-64-14]OZA67274.1 MAG: hypothetical protein B7X70_17940 [Acidovorax sp. 39-64-12]
MKTTQALIPVAQAAELIRQGKTLSIAGDEAALRQLPTGHWIGGTIPYFMAASGGTVSHDQVFVTEVSGFARQPEARFYDQESLAEVCRNAPENGYSIIIIPAFSACHASFAANAPTYEEMYMKPLVGWVAGVHLDDLDRIKPKVVLGSSGEFSEDKAVVMDVFLPPERFAQIDIVNLFQLGNGPGITFNEIGFTAGDCLIDGVPGNLADYLLEHGIDARLPLVADYSGAMINVSIKEINPTLRQVAFYAPVFPGVEYRVAAPVSNYPEAIKNALPEIDCPIAFSCNCILNYLYSDLQGKHTGHITGPMTFGEIGYQLLNQTMVYLTVSD